MTGLVVSGRINAIDMATRFSVTRIGSIPSMISLGSKPSAAMVSGAKRTRSSAQDASTKRPSHSWLSSRPTFRPWFARAYARLTETVDFPTPPFPLNTRMTYFTSIFAFWACAFGRLHWSADGHVSHFSSHSFAGVIVSSLISSPHAEIRSHSRQN